MRVVVTGAAGFIGSHVVDELLARGHAVVGIDSFTDYYPRPMKEANLTNARSHERFTFVEADLRSDPLEPFLEGADALINEAATPGLVLSWNDFDRYDSTNVIAVHRLIKASEAVGLPRFIQASTSSVYGPVATGSEDSPTKPASPYGVTKLAAEHLLLAHHQNFGFPVLVLRYFSIYGPRQRPDMGYRIFCERMLQDEPITVFGDGHQSRGNTYVSDCVGATILAIERGDPGQIMNIGGGVEIDVLTAIETLSEALGRSPRLEFRAARPGDQARTLADIRLATEVLGWAPHVAPDVGLRREAEWVLETYKPS